RFLNYCPSTFNSEFDRFILRLKQSIFYNMRQKLTVLCAILLFLVAEITTIQAQMPYSQWFGECERRNLIEGCACNCSLTKVNDTTATAQTCSLDTNTCGPQEFTRDANGNYFTAGASDITDETTQQF